ncbi:MAG: heme ABC transporter ATP-binding protein [Moheibacter sp.]
MIKGHQINYAHKKYHILHSVDISVQYGEFLAIVGPNGAGKSTLLSMLANELENKHPHSVLFKEKRFNQWNLKDLSKNKAKFSQHNTHDIPLMIKDVVMMGRYPYFNSTPNAVDEDAIENAMKETDVLHLKNREYNSLSGGEKQRVHLARVIAQLKNDVKHKLMFLDEPLNNLDVKHQYKALRLIKEFTANANTAIVVLHDLNLAAQFADNVLLMKNGKVAAHGNPHKVFNEKTISETYNFPCAICPNPITKNPMIIFGN